MRMRRFVELALLVIVAVLTGWPAWAQSCRADFLNCGSRRSDRLENATCRFTNSEPYLIYAVDAVAGQVLDVFLSSNDFPPYVALYEGGNDFPIVDDVGGMIVSLRYDVRRTGRYWILAAAAGPHRRGVFDLSMFCQTVCMAPFTTSGTSAIVIPFGSRPTVTIGADGTPPLSFRWFDAARPAETLVTTSTPFVLLNPLFATTTVNVEISNSCGRITRTAAIVTVEPCTKPAFPTPPPDRQAKAGEIVVLIAPSVTGTEPMSYRWYRGVPPDTSRPLGIDSAQRSFTMLAMPGSSGTYFLRATNICGSTDSPPLTLEVEGGGIKRRAVRH